MNQPSEEARYLASWLVQYQDEFNSAEADTTTSHVYYYAELNEEKLAECIQQYLDSRQ